MVATCYISIDTHSLSCMGRAMADTELMLRLSASCTYQSVEVV